MLLALAIISAVGTALAGVAALISALVALGVLPQRRREQPPPVVKEVKAMIPEDSGGHEVEDPACP